MFEKSAKIPLLSPLRKQCSDISVELTPVRQTQIFKQQRNSIVIEEHQNNSQKIDQILQARENWKLHLKMLPQIREQHKQISAQEYFGIDNIRLFELFDIKSMIKSVKAYEQDDQSNEKFEQVKYNKKKYLKVQLDKLYQFGGVYGLQNFLRTNIQSGLNKNDDFDISNRRRYYGINEKPPLSVRSLVSVMLTQLKNDKFFQIQLCVVIFNIIFLMFYQNQDIIQQDLNVLSLLCLFMLIKSYLKQAYNKEVVTHQYDVKHKQCYQSTRLNVIRNGIAQLIFSHELLVGDILTFSRGDIMQCDGIVTKLYGATLLVSQPTPYSIEQFEEKSADDQRNSTLLDETETSTQVRDPFIFSGSQIIEGDGELLVCAVGQRSSDYLYYQAAFAKESKQTNRAKQSKKAQLFIEEGRIVSIMHNPFGQKIDSYIRKQAVRSIIGIVFILIMLFYLSGYNLNPLKVANQLLYASLLMQLAIPIGFNQIICSFMIRNLRALRMKQIYIQDYMAYFWLGQINEVIIDECSQSVLALINSQVNVRLFTSESMEIALQNAREFGLIGQGNDEPGLKCIDSGYFTSLATEKSRFQFLSRRYASPQLDQINKIQSSSTLDWLEKQQQQFQFLGILESEQLCEQIMQIKVIARGSAKEKELLISMLKMYDRVILVNGDDTDRNSLELAHISIGTKITKATIKVANCNMSKSIYQCIGQGRSVYFILYQYAYAYSLTSFSVLIMAAIAVYCQQDPFIVSFECLLITYNCLHYLVIYSGSLEYQHIAMNQKPYTRMNRLIEKPTKLKIIKNALLICIELCLAQYYGYLGIVQSIFIGLLVSQHIYNTLASNKQIVQMISGVICGMILILLNIYFSDSYEEYYQILAYYFIGLVVVYFNQWISK